MRSTWYSKPVLSYGIHDTTKGKESVEYREEQLCGTYEGVACCTMCLCTSRKVRSGVTMGLEVHT